MWCHQTIFRLFLFFDDNCTYYPVLFHFKYFSCGLICSVHWLHSCLKNLWKSCVLCSPVRESWECHKIHPSVPVWVLVKGSHTRHGACRNKIMRLLAGNLIILFCLSFSKKGTHFFRFILHVQILCCKFWLWYERNSRLISQVTDSDTSVFVPHFCCGWLFWKLINIDYNTITFDLNLTNKCLGYAYCFLFESKF